MSPSEIAFLALGLVIGAAVGAAIAEALRARPAPRRHVRVTISPNSVHARRSSTLADQGDTAPRGPIPGSPEDGAWSAQAPDAAAVAPPAADGAPSAGQPGATPDRTRVPSPPVELPTGAVGVPVEGGSAGRAGSGRPTTGIGSPTPPGADDPGSPTPGASGGTGTVRPAPPEDPARGVATPLTTASSPRAVAVLDAAAPPAGPTGVASTPVMVMIPVARPGGMPSSLDVGAPVQGLAVRARPPALETYPATGSTVVAVAASGARQGARPPARDGEPGAGGPFSSPGAPSVSSDACDVPRRMVDERCALATAARQHASAAADALRAAQRAYDTLRERLDQAQADADPRGLAAAKDELHRRFREAGDAAAGADEAEAAAREWLNAINELNARAREAARLLETGGQELQATMPRLERLALEADAARISAEGAEAGCVEARERLAACEEDAAAAARRAAAGMPEPEEEPHPFDALWPGEAESTRTQPAEDEDAARRPSELPLVLRMLRGDRGSRDRLVATLAAGDPGSASAWQLRLTELMDAIVARAIEDGYLDLPGDDPFWGLFDPREQREIVGALSALGYRFDGLRGFADGRVPAARDLSLAVGYAGLDRMRIRTWPREGELASLYERATVAADEWLVDQADDLSLGRMVDALGSRAGDLADVWNAWGRLRPALLSSA